MSSYKEVDDTAKISLLYAVKQRIWSHSSQSKTTPTGEAIGRKAMVTLIVTKNMSYMGGSGTKVMGTLIVTKTLFYRGEVGQRLLSHSLQLEDLSPEKAVGQRL